jgi:hypothetical protein
MLVVDSEKLPLRREHYVCSEQAAKIKQIMVPHDDKTPLDLESAT